VLPAALRDQEKVLIEAALARSQGKVAGADGAAAQFGIPASTLESKIRQLKSNASTSASLVLAMSKRPSASADSASRTIFATFATLLHANVARSLSIDVGNTSSLPQMTDSSLEPSLNVARSTLTDMASAVFDSRRLHNLSI
jgi:hypothetical protein